jgi:hypothetical protein
MPDTKLPPVPTDTPEWSKFVQATASHFSNWTCLALAVDQCWGGMNSKQKGEKMLVDTLTLFSQGGFPVYADELSDFFEDTILDAFSTDAEDGSCREVAELVVKQFRLCVTEKDFTEADKVIATAGAAAQRALQHCVAAPTTVDTVTPGLSGGCPQDPGLGGGAGAMEMAPTQTKQAAANFSSNNVRRPYRSPMRAPRCMPPASVV